MKITILSAFVAFILALGVAYAEPATSPVPQQDGTQFNWTAGGAGWG